MAAIVIGTILGFIVGGATGWEGGVFTGGVVGMSAGLSWYGLGWLRDHTGSTPTLERHRVLCTPMGTPADCELVGDVERRRWIDVRRCSLLPGEAEPTCDKTCVRLMNAARVRPGASCSCE